MTDPNSTLCMRLWMASEQIRLTATSMAALAHEVDDDDARLVPHIERLESRAAELMRTAQRLARDAGVEQRWGLDVLFAEPEPAARALRNARREASVELEPLDLMAPLAPPRSRMLRRPRSPWMPALAAPSAPSADGAVEGVLGGE